MPFDGGGSRRDQIVARLEVLRELCSTNMDADQSDWKTCLWSEMRSCPRLPGLPLAEHRKLDCRPFWRIGRYFGLKKRKREYFDFLSAMPKSEKLPGIEWALARARDTR
jgi:hypothetical protein